jgi:hypothetical protein
LTNEPYGDETVPDETDYRFVERQIRVHVDLAQWHPDAHAFDAKPENWRRAYAIARLLADGESDSSTIAQRLGVDRQVIEEDRVLVPYLDRTIAGLLAVLGWYVNTDF